MGLMALHLLGKGTARHGMHSLEWGAQKPPVGGFLVQRQNARQYKGCCVGGVNF